MRIASAAILVWTISAFAVATTAEAANTRPLISGTPQPTASVGKRYAFQPYSYDPDGDVVSFSIKNLPPWASFSASTGRLAGTPMSWHQGEWPLIVITASDGKSYRSLPAFSITVRDDSAKLSWSKPVSNVDGSPLYDLAGYRIVYGQSPGALTKVRTIASPKATSAWIYNLTPGTWYFVIKAYNSAGVESEPSSPAQKSISY
jgi:hypothetical protein